MSKRAHQKSLERARARRASQRAVRRSQRNRILAIVLVVALAGAVFAVALFARGEDPDPVATPTDTLTPEPLAEPCDPAPAVEAPTPAATPFEAAPRVELDLDTVYTATLETTCGTVVVELDPSLAPRTVENFIALAQQGYYVGVPFHRVIEGFMIQGGDPAGTGCGQPDCANFDPDADTFPGYSFEDELDEAARVVAEQGGYPRGTLAMANSGENTNGSQFFIVQGTREGFEAVPLPASYTMFGRVVEGIEIVDRIAAGPSAGDQAVIPVRILSVTIEPVAGDRVGPTETTSPTTSPAPTEESS